MTEYTRDYLLNLKVTIFQPINGYRASTDAVLLSAMLKDIKDGDNILDIGSGTGAVSLCLAQRFVSKKISIKGLEIQPELAELSNQSSAANNFQNFLEYINFDISQKPVPFPHNSFSHVVTNPPYSAADMPSPNTSKSFAHNMQGTDLENWIKFCLKMLKPYGFFYMINRAEALPEILSSLHNKAGNINIIPIHSKPAQTAKRILVSAQKDSKSPATIYPGIIIHDQNGKYNAIAEQILRDGKSIFEVI